MGRDKSAPTLYYRFNLLISIIGPLRSTTSLHFLLANPKGDHKGPNPSPPRSRPYRDMRDCTAVSVSVVTFVTLVTLVTLVAFVLIMEGENSLFSVIT